jgi:hypothetical protein
MEYDSSGNLYAFTDTGLYRRATTGQISQVSNIYAPTPMNYGGDLSVNDSTTVPIPGAILLLGSGFIGLFGIRLKPKLSVSKK